jgi:hypothetical protein
MAPRRSFDELFHFEIRPAAQELALHPNVARLVGNCDSRRLRFRQGKQHTLKNTSAPYAAPCGDDAGGTQLMIELNNTRIQKSSRRDKSDRRGGWKLTRDGRGHMVLFNIRRGGKNGGLIAANNMPASKGERRPRIVACRG